MRRLFLSLFLSIATIMSCLSQLQSPDEFLPHKLGDHFTPHHLLIDYYQHVAANSPLVKLIEYGQTNQDRPLIVAFVTSEANHARLEEIRLNNLRMAGLEDGTPDMENARALVWLSFSVHGNEAAGSESSYQVLYDLVDPKNSKTKAWLDNTVVILDPSINPDGYSRYTHWVRNVTMDENNPDVQDIEHNEPWPGGRTNHYLFDLNRDWAWQTQIESQQRMKIYNQWLPHVHADLHEMGRESPYFFAPASKPFHPYITQWQRDFQVDIGKNNAKYFDQEGWLYFTKEVFDLFYPSYGDTYPTFSGAIGMTYEQGGGSGGGRAVELRNGEKLTLKDRVDHHKTTALSTIEITSVNAGKVTEHFNKFYNESRNSPPGQYKSFVIKKDQSGKRIQALAKLLDQQGIRFGTVSGTKEIMGYQYSKFGSGKILAEPGDLVVSAHQPKGLMTQILLEPSAELEDSVTYDITAWSLPYAYGLDGLASTNRIEGEIPWTHLPSYKTPEAGYAYLVPRMDMESVKLVSKLVADDISLRVLPKEVQYDGRKYQAGTAVITRADNRSLGDDLLPKIKEAQKGINAEIISISTGFAESGPDLGSGRIDLIEKPKVLTFSGEGIASNSFGQLKWYFDRVIDYPLSVVDIKNIDRINLDKYNTLILTDGRYNFSTGIMERISSWIGQGGKLIAIGSATRKFIDAEGFKLKKFATEDEKKEEKEASEAADLEARYNHYSESERLAISGRVPGAIFQLKVDSSHPLGFGLGDQYYSLRTSNTFFPLVVGAENIIYHPKEGGHVLGFAGKKIKDKLKDTAVCVVESKGRGTVIYIADNPLFRGFWYNGLFLFSNALFIVN